MEGIIGIRIFEGKRRGRNHAPAVTRKKKRNSSMYIKILKGRAGRCLFHAMGDHNKWCTKEKKKKKKTLEEEMVVKHETMCGLDRPKGS